MLKKVQEPIEKLLIKAGVTGKINFTIPPNPEMGDLSFACFDLAKELKKNPVEVANEVKSKVISLKSKVVERVEAVGPYVNFYLNGGELAKIVINEIEKKEKKYGNNKIGKGKKVLVEYPSNNTHKELHVGHLRNICIGNSLAHIFSASGFKVIPVNYLNDFGAHVVKCLWGLNKFHSSENPPENKQKWLGEIYAEASKYLEEHGEDKEEIYELQKKFEAKDKNIWPLFLKTRKWSMDGFKKVFEEMKVVHKNVFYEKDVKEIGQKMVDELLEKGIAKIGEGGAIIIDLTEYNLDIGLLRKSTGAGLYLTSDLGLAVAKNKKYKVDESIHITASEQNFYFKQLFKILELAGYQYRMTHIGYGLVTLPSGKISSRAGNVVLYDDVKDNVYEKVLQEVKNRHADWPTEKVEHTARVIAFAAIKFDFLKHEASKTIVFDANSATSFDGFSGPYVLYSVARINSLLKKSKVFSLKSKVNFDLLKNIEEKKLLLLMADYDEMIKKALENYNPSVIVKYSFELAKLYNDFYNKHSVLSAETPELIEARLFLSLTVKKVLENALGLLTIDTVEEM